MHNCIKAAFIFVLLILYSCSQNTRGSAPEAELTESPAPMAPAERSVDETPAEPSVAVDAAREFSMEARSAPKPTAPAASGLKAAFADDNEQFNAYLEFLEKYKDVPQIAFPVKERMVLHLIDEAGLPIPDALIKIAASKELMSAKTLSNGETLFFPSEYSEDDYKVSIEYNGTSKSFPLKRSDKREQTFKLPIK
jgi:hypothetical protein